jgi:hypothetical protein
LPVIPILGIAFVLLKVTGYIDWSWLWVLSPFWIGLAAVLVVWFLIFGGLTALLAWASKPTPKRR